MIAVASPKLHASSKYIMYHVMHAPDTFDSYDSASDLFVAVIILW